MANWEQMMISLYGKNNTGFTLLEVVVAITIFAIAFTVLLKIQSQHISDMENQLQRLKALQFFKLKVYNISDKSVDTTRFKMKRESKTIDFGIKQITYIISDKQNQKILEIKTYER